MQMSVWTFSFFTLFTLGVLAKDIALNPEGSLPFSHEMLIARAAIAAQEPFIPYEDSRELIPVSPQDWFKIRFLQGYMPWNHGAHQSFIELNYPASFFPSRARAFWVDHGTVGEIVFSNDLFDGVPPDTKISSSSRPGFSGLRYLTDLRSGEESRESWLMFLGDQSYRAKIGNGPYGSYCIPLNVTLKSHEAYEKAPQFTEFYLESRETPDSPEVLYTVIDGTALTGVYRFSTRRNATGVIQDVEATLFIRRSVVTLDLIPLVTSFAFSEVDREKYSDVQPEVHDADGLLLHEKQDAWFWRPLNIPNDTRTSVFKVDTLTGLGLIQRDRDPDHYQEASSPHLAPNVWIEPIEPFGAGEIRLTEQGKNVPSTENVWIAYRPSGETLPGSSLHLHYKIHWIADNPEANGLARCIATRIGRLNEKNGKRPPEAYRFRLEYQGTSIARNDLSDETLKVTLSNGNLLGKRIIHPPHSTRWFAEVDLKLASEGEAELEVIPERNGRPFAEGWRYSFKAP